MENTVAVMMPKGGTGKTTTAVNLAGALSSLSKKVLLVDNDWQGSASVHCGIKEPDDLTESLADALANRIPVQKAIRKMANGIDLLPGNGELANVDVELLSMGEAGIYRLRETLKPIADQYDVILIDNEPGMHVRSLGALAAADYLLVPVSADYLSLKPLKLFLRVLRTASQRYRLPKHQVGVLATRFDGRQNQAIEVVDILKRLAPAAGLEYFGLIIPERAAHRRAAAAGETLVQFENKESDLNLLYRELAEKVMAW